MLMGGRIHNVLCGCVRKHTIQTKAFGGAFGRMLGFLFVGFIAATASTSGETSSECARRIADLRKTTPHLKETAEGWMIPTAYLQKDPLFFRNLIVQVYQQPFLASFFYGLKDAPVSIHYAERAYEFTNLVAELDRQGTYRFEDVVELLRVMTAHEGSSSVKKLSDTFDIDFSYVETRGLYLRFLDRGKSTEAEKKLKQRFAEAWVQNLSRKMGPLPVRPFHYISTDDTSFIIESAFFADEVYARTRDFVTTELNLPWKDFDTLFRRRFPRRDLDFHLASHGKMTLKIYPRYAHPTNAEQYLYEVVPLQSEKVGILDALYLNGQKVHWHQKNDGSRVGLVSLSELSFDGNMSEIEIELRSRRTVLAEIEAKSAVKAVFSEEHLRV